MTHLNGRTDYSPGCLPACLLLTYKHYHPSSSSSSSSSKNQNLLMASYTTATSSSSSSSSSSVICFPTTTSLQHHQLPSIRKPLNRRLPISASISEKPSSPLLSTSSSSSSSSSSLPIRKIPGDHGIPFISPFRDRLDYFYFQGRDLYFQSKISKYQSTVFRANMPPGPFISSNPNVIVLLDGKSFPILFDNFKVEKKDVFTGTYMPSTKLTGGYRLLPYLDPSEPNHAKIKQLIFFLMKSSSRRVIPEFQSCFGELFDTLELDLASKGKADFVEHNDQASFNFLNRSLFGVNPLDTKLGSAGPGIVTKWILFQLSPVLTFGLPWFIDDALLHTFRLPPGLIKSEYQKLYDFFYESASWVLDEGEKMGIGRDEACHNLIFSTCFNSHGGFKLFFPNLIKWIGRAGVKVHRQLAEEIRSAVKSNGGVINMSVLEQMPLVKSVVYEAYRIEPPVPSQYARAKEDLLIESHDYAYEVKKGEMLFGFQPIATKDPRIFERSEEFVPDRFVVEEGEKLLKHVFWSNGRETENPTLDNKQCAGKDFVVLVSRLLVVEMFLRYDTFEIQSKKSALGVSLTLTSLKRAATF